MAKRPRKDYAPHINTDRPPACEVAGCAQEGLYKAPKGRSSLHEYRFLCLEHIREHNLKWDYFRGMNADEIEAFMKDAVTGHRPTWERTAHIPNAHEKLYAAVNEFLHGTRKKTKANPQLPAKLRKALAVLELEYPYSATDLKKRYKELVKRYHPDRNRDDKLAEEKFKAIASAYKLLGEHIAQT